jgi:S1-C subfamily serine protease
MRQIFQFMYYCMSAIVLLLFTGCTISISSGWDNKSRHTTSTAPMLRKVLPAVVNVFSEGDRVSCVNFLPDNPNLKKQLELDKNPSEACLSQSQGSGVIIDAKQGYIVTNYHNIQDAIRTIITLHDQREIVAEVVGFDAATDLALLKIQADRLSELKLSNADKQLETGDFLVTIGSPFGLDHSVTFGIVSALGRSGLGLEGYEDFIQTDASINVGNSGGAVVAMNGKLVGISTAIVGANNSNTGIGFAISGSMVKAVVKQLTQYGNIKRGLIGVVVEDIMVNNKLRALVGNVIPNSPAEIAGLKKGDIILRYNGNIVKGATKLRNALGLTRIGEKTQLEVLRRYSKQQKIINISVSVADPAR